MKEVLLALLLALAGATDKGKAPRPEMVTASEWGSRPQAIDQSRKQTPKFITVHHAGVLWKEGDDPLKKIQALQKWGQTQKAWPDLPYHFLIAPDGRIFEGRPVVYQPESNTKYELAGNIGVELWGEFNSQRVSRQQLESLVKLAAWLCAEYEIDPKSIRGHRDIAQTACPGRDLHRYIKDGTLQEWIAQAARGRRADVKLAEALPGGPVEMIPVATESPADK